LSPWGHLEKFPNCIWRAPYYGRNIPPHEREEKVCYTLKTLNPKPIEKGAILGMKGQLEVGNADVGL